MLFKKVRDCSVFVVVLEADNHPYFAFINFLAGREVDSCRSRSRHVRMFDTLFRLRPSCVSRCVPVADEPLRRRRIVNRRSRYSVVPPVKLRRLRRMLHRICLKNAVNVPPVLTARMEDVNVEGGDQYSREEFLNVEFVRMPEDIQKFGQWRSHMIETLRPLPGGKLPVILYHSFTDALGHLTSWARSYDGLRARIYANPIKVIEEEVSQEVLKRSKVVKYCLSLQAQASASAASMAQRKKWLTEFSQLRAAMDPAALADALFIVFAREIVSPSVMEGVDALGLTETVPQIVERLRSALGARADREDQERVVAFAHRMAPRGPRGPQQRPRKKRRIQSEDSAPRSSAMSKEERRAHYAEMRERLTADERAKRMIYACHICGERGHFASECLDINSDLYHVHVVGGRRSMIFRLKVGGRMLSCLYDTGAAVSLLRENALDGLQTLEGVEEYVGAPVVSATGAPMHVTGSVRVEVVCDGRVIKPIFLITKNLNEGSAFDAIIGCDTILHYGVALSLQPLQLVVNAVATEVRIQNPDVRRIAAKFPNVLVNELGADVGKANVPELELELDPTVKAQYSRNYRMSHEQLATVEEEVAKMLESGVIEECPPSSSMKGWNSPVLLVPKKDKSWRFCIDFRKLNAATWKENAPLPRIAELLEEAAGAKIFSKLDLASGYWQIPVAKKSRQYLAFESAKRQYRFKVMPFGIANAPAMFQKMMDSLIGDLPGVSGYIDDVVVYSKTKEEHLKTLTELFGRLKKYGLKANARKCEFCLESIDAFGFTITNGKVTPSTKRVEALKRLKKPEKAKEMQSFIGMMNYYRGLLDHFADSEAALREFCGTLKWTEECEKAYTGLLAQLEALPGIYPRYLDAEALELHTDASNVAVAGVLMQRRRAGTLYPVAFFSRMLKKPAEQNYSATEKELLAIHNSLMQFKHYIGSKHVTIRTDHKPLLGILTTKESPFGGRWSRRIFQLAEFRFDVKYVEGRLNVVPDHLSRYVINVIRLEWPSIAVMQATDKEVQQVRQTRKDIVMEAGVVCVVDESGLPKVVLPQVLRQEAITDAHTEGHFGLKKTLHRVKQHFFWPGMTGDVEKHIQGCAACTQKKNPILRPAVLQHLEKGQETGAVWAHLAMDHFGPFAGPRGKVWVFVVMVMFTRWPKLQ